MPGAIIGDLDVAQLLVIVFFLFFFGLVLHLRTEDKREGYPLVDPAGGSDGEGFPPMPAPKVFHLRQGGEVFAPAPDPQRPIAAERLLPFPGAPLQPTGDPLADGVGPASWALRREEPLWYSVGVAQLAPLRTVEGWRLAKGDLELRGLPVIDSRGERAGVVRDLWLDRGVRIIRYLEVEGEDGARTLLPIHHTDLRRIQARVALRGGVRAAAVAASPRLASPDAVTAREEDRINAHFAGAAFYGRNPARPPWLAPWERRAPARRGGALESAR